MASRKEQKEKLRQERLEREQAAAAAAARKRRTGYAVAGVLVAAVVVALAVIVFAGGGDSGSGSSSADWPSGSIPARKISDLDAAVKAAGCKLSSPKDEGRGHVASTKTRVTYKSQPPTSGKHYQVPSHDAAYIKSPS